MTVAPADANTGNPTVVGCAQGGAAVPSAPPEPTASVEPCGVPPPHSATDAQAGEVAENASPVAKPILFSGPMVRAILAGKKTQTRRIMKPQPDFLGGRGMEDDLSNWGWEDCDRGGYVVLKADRRDGDQRQHYPRWFVGDRLWVKETWGFNPDHPSVPEFACFRADPGHEHDGIKWKSPIHMPRRASRITLEVTAVRFERLQAITDADALAEGIECAAEWREDNPPHICYSVLFDHINGPGTWLYNPWVTVIEFRR